MEEENKSEQTSIVDPDEFRRNEEHQKIKEKLQKQTQPTTQNPLALLEKFDKLIELKKEQNEIIKENTAAMNALTSTLVAQVRKNISEIPNKTTPVRISQSTTTEELQTPQKGTPLPPPKQKEVAIPQNSTIVEHAKGCFTNNLTTLLTFTDEGEYVKIKPIKYLGSDSFAKIASTIRELDGEYVSAGKESHFRLPKRSIQK